jgi:hypothetical protein
VAARPWRVFDKSHHKHFLGKNFLGINGLVAASRWNVLELLVGNGDASRAAIFGRGSLARWHETGSAALVVVALLRA